MGKICIDKDIDDWLFKVENETSYFAIYSYRGKCVEVKTNNKKAIDWLENALCNYFEKEECVILNLTKIIAVYVSEIEVDERFLEKSLMMYLQTKGRKIKEGVSRAKLYYNVQKKYIHAVYDNYNILLIQDNIQDNIRLPFRFCREILLSPDNSRKYHRFHAASVIDDFENAWIIFGASGAGKTSFLLGALYGGCSLCSNDRTIVYMNKKKLLNVAGVPTSIRLSERQLDTISHMLIKDKMQTNAYRDIGIKNGKKEFSADELGRYYETCIKNSCLLKGVIVVGFSCAEIHSFRIIDKNEKKKYIFSNYMAEDSAFPNYFQKRNQNEIDIKLIDNMLEIPWYYVTGWLYDSYKLDFWRY